MGVGGGVLVAFTGQRTEMLLNILQCTEQSPETKNYPVPSIYMLSWLRLTEASGDHGVFILGLFQHLDGCLVPLETGLSS